MHARSFAGTKKRTYSPLERCKKKGFGIERYLKRYLGEAFQIPDFRLKPLHFHALTGMMRVEWSG